MKKRNVQNKIKTLFVIVTIFSLLIILTGKTVIALTMDNVTRKAEEIENGKYKISVNIPIDEKEFSGYNVIFSMDISTVSKSTWNGMRSAMIDLVEELLPSTVPEENVNKVGMICYGISGFVNIPLTSDKAQFTALPTGNPNQLYWPRRTSSNNESGFVVTNEYLKNLNIADKKSKEKTIVIYLTDGQTNMNEKELNWYQLMRDGAKYGSIRVDDYSKNTLLSTLVELDANPDFI